MIDLDVQPGVVQQLGQSGAWALACRASDELVVAARSAGFPCPARKFSGSRGIHLVWDLEPGALELDPATGFVDLPGYVAAVRQAEPKAGYLVANKDLLASPARASKVILQAVVLLAMHGGIAGSSFLDARERSVLAVAKTGGVLALDKGDPRADLKIIADTQPTVHRWLSPHLKSGLVSRSVVDAMGEILPEFRSYLTVVAESEIGHVTEAV